MSNYCRLFFFIIVCFLPGGAAFSLGKAEKTPEKINPTWTLCVTKFDVSALPPARAATGDVIARQLTSHFDGLKFKMRPVNEYDYYWQAAWLRNQTDSAKKIAAKQAERDKVIYSGEAGWKIRMMQRRLDGEIKTLRSDFDNAALVSPNISWEPSFTVTEENRTGNFPTAPAAGAEFDLCSRQKTDGLLLAKVSEYHGRILVELRMWSLWARKITYEDRELFSIEDIDIALDEFSTRLINSIGGMEPATILVRAEPPGAVIIIDEHHAGRGKSDVTERTPGPVDITVYAEDHVTATEKIDLAEGEQVEADFKLKPLPQGQVNIDVSGEESATLYSGALFIGEVPKSLRGQIDRYKHISIETPSGKVAQSLFRIENPPSHITLKPKIPPLEGRTEKARKGFYGAVGRLWVVGSMAFLSAGYSNLTVDAFNMSNNKTQKHFDEQALMYNISMGFMIATGVAALEVVVRLIIYIYQGNREGSIFASKSDKENKN